MCTHWSDGGNGAKELAQNVVDICEESKIHLNFYMKTIYLYLKK